MELRSKFCQPFLNMYPIFKKGGLAGPQFLEGGYWERGGDFFQGGLQLLHKLKSEIFNIEI